MRCFHCSGRHKMPFHRFFCRCLVLRFAFITVILQRFSRGIGLLHRWLLAWDAFHTAPFRGRALDAVSALAAFDLCLSVDRSCLRGNKTPFARKKSVFGGSGTSAPSHHSGGIDAGAVRWGIDAHLCRSWRDRRAGWGGTAFTFCKRGLRGGGCTACENSTVYPRFFIIYG